MANKTPIASWVYSNKKELNPSFTEFTWPKRIFPDLYDFASTVEWNGLKGEGRGVDLSREIALEKSMAEAVERLICSHFKFKTIGVAVSGTLDPNKHAKNEVLERYYLYQHRINSIPFEKIQFTNSLIHKFKKYQSLINIEFFRMNTRLDSFGIVCSLKTEKIQRALGFALDESIDTSISRAFLEAIPNYAFILEDSQGLEKSGLPWHLSKSFLNEIEPLLTKVSAKFKEQPLPNLEKVDVMLEEISILKTAPFQIARYIESNL